MEEYIMPLHKFITEPIVNDLLHDGATFQIAGLTNNSYLVEANEVRHCVRNYRSLGEYVLEVAKKRLDHMLYVGLTDHHKESATIFANAVGEQVISQLQRWKFRSDNTAKNQTGLISSYSDSDNEQLQIISDEKILDISSTGKTGEKIGTMTVEELVESFETCVFALRKKRALRRSTTLKQMSPANLSNEARFQVPETVLQQIKSLNSLDMELYKHARNIYAQQKERMTSKLVKAERLNNAFYNSYANLFNNPYANTIWIGILLTVVVTLLFSVILVILRSCLSRDISKLKL